MDDAGLAWRPLLAGTLQRLRKLALLAMVLVAVGYAARSLGEWRLVFDIRTLIGMLFGVAIFAGPLEAAVRRNAATDRLRSPETLLACAWSAGWAVAWTLAASAFLASSPLRALVAAAVFGTLGAGIALIPPPRRGRDG